MSNADNNPLAVTTEAGEMNPARKDPPRISIGRIVHYHERKQTFAGIVTGVDADGSSVSLACFGVRTHIDRDHVKFAESPTDLCWTWPPKV